MIPAIYPLVGLTACCCALAVVFLAPSLGVFRKLWFAIPAVALMLWAGDKPTPPPRPPKGNVTISLVGATPTNVTLSVVATTNELLMARRWQARRMFWRENVASWGSWQDVGESGTILSTNFTETVSGQFVNERRDTQLRLVYGDAATNEVTP